MDGAADTPGVHSELKKLWFAPAMYRALCSALPRLTPRVESMYCWPWRFSSDPLKSAAWSRTPHSKQSGAG